MGLDTTHDCWHGSYGSFKAFRDAVADAAMEVYGYKPDYEEHPSRAFYGWWDEDHPYSNVLDVFFVHSDCEGFIFPYDAQDLFPALTRLLAVMDEGWMRHLAQFIVGLKQAVDAWEIVEFH